MAVTTRLRLAAVAVFAMAPLAAHAQTTAQFPIQFDFLNPGARSLALGSAFIGLADDASAGFTNPAGLLHLIEPEVSFEGRYRQLDTQYLQSGRISGTVQNIGEDRSAGPVYAQTGEGSFGPSFVSFTYPTRHWAVAVFRHELSRVENAFLYRGVFERASFAGVTDDRNRDIPLSGTRTISIDNYGVSGAVRLGDLISVGAGIGFYRFNLDASFVRLGLEDFYGPPTAPDGGSTAVQSGGGIAAGLNVGVQAQMTPTLRLGAVYKRAPDFRFTQVDEIPFRATLTRTGDFQIPDTFGIGAAWRATETVTIAADYVYVTHGDLKSDFINFQAISTGREGQLEIKNAHEIHFGAEWAVTQLSFAPALRAGVWFDPDHAVRYVSDGTNDQTDTRFQFILPGGDDLWHYTVGVGLPVSKRLELNAGADITKRSAYASASLIVRFF